MSTIQVDNILNQNGTDLPDNLLPVTASAWLLYDAVTQSIIESYNVTSVTYNSVGNLTLNYTNNISLNQVISGTVNSEGAVVSVITASRTTSSVDIHTTSQSNTLTNYSETSVIIFGN